MKKTHKYIVLTYGLFLAWLLSFPYNGPVLKHLLSLYGLPIASFSLTYTVAPAIFLVIYAFLPKNEARTKKMMTWCMSVCLLGTIIIFSVHPSYWYPFLAVMGICSVLYIISWSFFYTMEIPIKQKMAVMALVIIVGNVIYYFINLLLGHLSNGLILLIMMILLGGSYLAAVKTNIEDRIDIPLEEEPFPGKLILVICLFLFIIKLNHGLSFHAIQPSFDNLFKQYYKYYGMLPYIVVLAIMYFYSSKLSGMFPIFLGTSLLGVAYLAFGLLNENWYSYFLTETFLQSGRALLDLFIWTLFGIVASIYGRPLKICGYAFLANLSAVFAGGLLGVTILKRQEDYYLVSAIFALGIIFISILIIFWLNEGIEKDLRAKLLKTRFAADGTGDSSALSINLPNSRLLTPRESEITELLIQGYTNKQIAEMLTISENTIKTHTRNIYSKLNVANKRELLQRFFAAANSNS